MKIKTILPLIVTILLLAGLVTTGFAESYAGIREDYQQLIQSSQLQRQRSNWDNLIQRFERFIKNNPQDPEVDKASFLLAKTWDGLSKASGSSRDAREAVDAYLTMADRFPTNALADDALFLAGQAAEYRLDDKTRAFKIYRKLITDLSAGDMVGAARERLAKLRPGQDHSTQQENDDFQAVGEAPRLERIRFWSGPEYTRVVLDLTAPVVARPNYLKGDNPRLYFDLLYTDLEAGLPASLPINNGLIQQIRTSRFDEQRSRVVLDLDHVADYELITLDNPNRLVIDVKGHPTRAAFSAPPDSSGAGGSALDDSISSILDQSKDVSPVLHIPQETRDEGIRLIVVDAGHGGKDPGAIGPNNLMEKNVTLAMAKSLAEALRQQLGVKVMLTRSDDRFLELRERTDFANRVGADLFISLHANASHSHNAYGVETYFLNLSKNNQAAEVAARENGTSLQEVGNLEAILFDLMANAKINESSRLAAEVQQALMSGLKPHYSKIRDLGVKQGPFHVLLGATMPSVLVEAAFISNPREAKRLVSSGYQNRVAAAIVKGVKHYSAAMDQVAKR